MENNGFKRPIRALIFGGFILALVAVAIMSYKAFLSVNDMANSLEEAAEPDEYLETLKMLSDDMHDAQSIVQTFTLSRNFDTLDSYITVLGQIRDRIDELDELSTDSDIRKERIDGMVELIEQKFSIVDSLINLADDGNQESAFDKLATKVEQQFQKSRKQAYQRANEENNNSSQNPSEKIDINEIAEDLTSQKVEEISLSPEEKKPVKKKRNLFKNLFTRKNKKGSKKDEKGEENEDPSSKPELEKSDKTIAETPSSTSKPLPVIPSKDDKYLKKLQADVKQLKIEQKKESETRLIAESKINRLAQEDIKMVSQIRGMIRTMESEQKEENEQRAKTADKKSRNTARFIGVFSVVVLLLCMTLLIIIFNDISRNRKLQARLRQEKARAEKLAKAKEEFLANMSHEIRTPMNAVIGFSEQLAGTKLNKKQTGFLQPIRNSASYLLGLINDILDYSKIESGSFKLEKTGFQPVNILDEVHSTFDSSAETKGVELVCKVDSEVPEIVVGDPLRLKQMMFNLISNAIKFTEKGQIIASCKLASMKENTALLAFSVKDSGIGIAEDRLKLIFEDFVQADSSTTRKYGGTGLGLSITKKLAEMHAGHVDVQSEVGKGTEITLYIPYDIGTKDDLEIIVSPTQEDFTKLIGKNVLVADDEPYNRLLVRAIMDKWGVNIVDVENGRHVIDLIKSGKHFDFVLMDLQMPEMDGFEAGRQIREELKSDIPILALTATATQQEIERSRDIGMNAHLLKPFKERELYALILKTLNIENDHELSQAELAAKEEERITQEIAELAAAMEPIEKEESQIEKIVEEPQFKPNMPAYNFDELYRLANKDKKFMINMLNIFVSSTNKNLAVMMEGLDKNDWDEVSMRAHKIIPPSRHLGLHAIVEKLKFIEIEGMNKTSLDVLPDSVKKVATEIEETINSIKKDIEEMK